uniref:Zinc finger protein 619 n=1 Tax=Molossus molossus TaxID=27622 RepID=A0A7J8DEU5_MOLMO|nr:zinc finger protein 619 [Molossus molossus]
MVSSPEKVARPQPEAEGDAPGEGAALACRRSLGGWLQEPVACEDAAVYFTRNQWASLAPVQRALCGR